MFRAVKKGGSISEEDPHQWKERFRILFEQNVAGVSLTNMDGRIIDCNESCARIFGFESRNEMLAHSAWDFYFDRTEREVLIHRLRSRGDCPAEEICFRNKDGLPVWVLSTRTVADFKDGQPEMLISTAIDVTAQRKAHTRLRETKEPIAGRPNIERDRLVEMSETLGSLLQRVNQALRPDNLPQMGRTEIREFLLLLEEMKMLMSELEIIGLLGK